MLKHKLSRRTRAVLVAATATAALVIAPASASALPILGHAPISTVEIDTGIASDTDADELLDRCPVDGPATYEDSWGWARSGGRSHEGVDMIADRGTPVVAATAGDALFKNNRLGGNAVWLTAPNGDKFYYAHLDGFEGESRRVQAGDVIGYVGSTGNAQGPHLHFETLPGAAVENPYPHTIAACVPTAEELVAIEAQADRPLRDPDLGDEPTPND